MPFSDNHGPNGLAVAGKVVFLAGGQTVEAIAVSNPLRPVKVAAQCTTEALPSGTNNAHDLAYRDGLLYVTGQVDHCLVILRVENEGVPPYRGTRTDYGCLPNTESVPEYHYRFVSPMYVRRLRWRRLVWAHSVRTHSGPESHGIALASGEVVMSRRVLTRLSSHGARSTSFGQGEKR